MQSRDTGSTHHAQNDPIVPARIAVNRVPLERPWEWLAAGWRDLWTRPAVSLFYGLAAALLGAALSVGLALIGWEAAIPVAVGGFLLIGPLLAAGLYDKSRRLARGDRCSLADTLRVAFGSAGALAFYVTILLLVYLVWARIAILLLALFLGTTAPPSPQTFLSTLLFTPHGLGLLVVGTAVGALLASLVFAISVVAIPLLMDRRVDAFTAMAASVRSIAENPWPMALWAALIAGIFSLSAATLGVGLIIAFPLLGHATWHAYRDVIADS